MAERITFTGYTIHDRRDDTHTYRDYLAIDSDGQQYIALQGNATVKSKFKYTYTVKIPNYQGRTRLTNRTDVENLLADLKSGKVSVAVGSWTPIADSRIDCESTEGQGSADENAPLGNTPQASQANSHPVN